MPLPRFHRLAPERQHAVLAAAAAEFAAHGFHEASLNRIQAQLGLSKGAFYYWFDDKSDLFLSTLEDRLARLSTAVGGLASGAVGPAPLWSQVEATLSSVLEQVSADPQGMQLLKAAVALGPDSSPRMRALWHAGDALVAHVLTVGQQRGEVRTDLPLSLLVRVVLGVLEAVDRHLLEGDGDQDEEGAVVPLYLDLLSRVVSPTEAGEGEGERERARRKPMSE